jgi:iron complex transport system substrate-binding protein
VLFRSELRNCDTDVSIPVPPERVVAIKSTSIEMLLALGLGDRIVGTAFADGPVPDEWAADAADLPVLSDFMPSEEAVLELEPDLVYAGWESAFAADAAGERAELARLGIASYVQPAACRSEGAPARLDFDEVFREIEEVAAIFDVDPSALVADQRARLAALEPDDRRLTALWYSSGTDTPYVGAGTGAPQMVMDAVGLSNIAADIDMTWSTLSWEAIVAADPDVIVLVDADWNTAASKIELLEQNPATAELSAVRAGRYLVLPFPATEAGVRSVAAAESLAAQLRELDLP